MVATRTLLLSGGLAACLSSCLSAPVPLAVSLPPRATRCVHEDIPEGFDGTVELFVESGGSLNVHLHVQGPMTKGWGDVPEVSEKTISLIDEVVSNAEDGSFDDSYYYSFRSKGGVYQACVTNDMNHIVPKVLELNIRSTSRPVGEPIKLLTAGSKEDEGAALSDEEKKKQREKQKEVANLEASIFRLKTTLKKVQRLQRMERHRQTVHSAVNEENNNHMVVGSLIETAVFIGAAIFQIIFVRNWFENRKTRQWA